MYSLDTIQENPNRRLSNLPFDIDEYINKKKEQINNNYKGDMLIYHESKLQQEKSEYIRCLDLIIGKFNKDRYNIKIDMYSSINEKMLIYAIKNFYYILHTKGYTYTERTEEERVCDAMDGNIMKSYKIIKVE